ncbi:Integrator complex subunit 2 [Physocladia obscura]|uniref:Integrator complex subunit 2 n=1 Tax=Physocladia obscura TaxID=109957 RepID=A0AAD5TA67_9FUNG|nr:Integrator complex subunit 2 [Physocladia obscura]
MTECSSFKILAALFSFLVSETVPIVDLAESILLSLANLLPEIALDIRETLIKLNKLPHIILRISIQSNDHEKYLAALRHATQSDLSEFTLMNAVYFHTNQLVEIINAIRSVLDLPVQICNEMEIARRALVLKPESSKSLAITVVYELLKAGIFLRVNFDVKQWVFDNIMSLKPPFDNQFPELIKLFVNSVVESHVFSKITEIEVTKCFQSALTEISSKHVLLLFQVLQFNNRVFNKKITLERETGKTFDSCQEYPAFVMDSIPINRILLFIERPENRETYQAFYPSLVSLVASQYPQILTVSSFLHGENRVDEYI